MIINLTGNKYVLQKIKTMHGTTPLNVTSATVAQIKQAIIDKTPLVGISCFGSHYRPDIDELVAFAFILMKELGGKLFPSIAGKNHLKLRIVGEKEVSSLGEDAWYKLLQQGCLAVGTAGGPLDDHGQGNETSAAQKVAELLGVQEKPWLSQILAYVNATDNGEKAIPPGYSGPTSPMIKATWRILEEDGRLDNEMIPRAEEFISLVKRHLIDQMRFEKAKRTLAPSIKLLDIPNQHKRKVAVTHSDNERAVSVTRYLHHTSELALIVQIKSSGNFHIHHAQKGSASRKEMDNVVGMIRLGIVQFVNQKMPKGKKVRLTGDQATQDGKEQNTPEIFYYADAGMVLNGSLTQLDVDPVVGEEGRYPFTKESLVETIISALSSADQDESSPTRSATKPERFVTPRPEQSGTAKFKTISIDYTAGALTVHIAKS